MATIQQITPELEASDSVTGTGQIEGNSSLLTTSAESYQFLLFALGEEQYGVAIHKVQEIKGFSKITPLPNTPNYVKGVLNLRGNIVPIFDLRIKLGMEQAEPSPFTVIIVVVVWNQAIGLVVDYVSDVITWDSKEIKPPPVLGNTVDTSCIVGIGSSGDQLVTLLDVNHVLAENEITGLEGIIHETDSEKK